MPTLRAEYRHRETPHEADARQWGSTPWFERHRKARAAHHRAARRRLRHSARAELRELVRDLGKRA